MTLTLYDKIRPETALDNVWVEW